MRKLVLILMVVFALSSCTENQRAKSFGGSAQINLEPGKKLVNVTWKGEDMWYLVRDMKDGESPERYEFVEESSFGVLNGTVVILERVK